MDHDFQTECEFLAHITEVLCYLKTYLDEHPVDYPPMMKVYATLLYGVVPTIKVKCDHDPECSIEGKEPCGGFYDLAEVLDEAMECLDLEMDYEVPAFVYPADYQI